MRIKKKRLFYCPDQTYDESIIGRISPMSPNYLMNYYGYNDRHLYWVNRVVYSGHMFPDYKPLIGGMVLARAAKPVDFIKPANYSYPPFLSKKAVDNLSILNVGTHKIYPARIYVKKRPLLYFLIALIPFGQYDYIIWDKCRFKKVEQDNDSTDRVYFKNLHTEVPLFKSIDDYYIFGALHTIRAERIAVNEHFPIDLDCFCFNYSNQIYVSEKFVEVVKVNGLSGLEFKRKVQIVQYG